MTDEQAVSAALAGFAAALRIDDLPADVVHQAVRCLVDWLGCTIAGSATAEGERVRAGIGALDAGDGSRTAPIVGTRQRAGAGYAALANGIAAHVLDFDDTFNPDRTTIHGSAPLWPAIAAAGRTRPGLRVAAVEAFVAGFEVQTRVAVAAGPGHYDAGWHVTGTVGHIGAAAATARLLGLSPEQTLAAIGTGATQAAGMKVVYGSMGKSLHPGKAAMDGLLSGFLARDGFTSSPEPIEGHRGFLHLFSPDPVPSRAVDGLGDTWYLPRDGFKPYACGSLTHPPAQALLELRAEHGSDGRRRRGRRRLRARLRQDHDRADRTGHRAAGEVQHLPRARGCARRRSGAARPVHRRAGRRPCTGRASGQGSRPHRRRTDKGFRTSRVDAQGRSHARAPRRPQPRHSRQPHERRATRRTNSSASPPRCSAAPAPTRSQRRAGA